MLFHSFVFIGVFLPVVWVGYRLLGRTRHDVLPKVWLIAASIAFYAFWNPIYVFLLAGSVGANYAIGRGLTTARSVANARRLLVLGITANLAVLGYFKYYNFFVENVNSWFGLGIGIETILLPLGISFITFQQVAFLVDSYRKQVAGETTFVSYAMFILFFPQLVAGPIVHHAEMVPQFANRLLGRFSAADFQAGIAIFVVGLLKKVVVADTFARWANDGYGDPASLSLASAWATSLSYTIQLYFDFSGYTDMAIGAALLFNIRLPLNFDAPYRAASVREFWTRWHITLSRVRLYPVRRQSRRASPGAPEPVHYHGTRWSMARGRLAVHRLGAGARGGTVCGTRVVEQRRALADVGGVAVDDPVRQRDLGAIQG